MSRVSAEVVERIEKLKNVSKLSWIGVVNRLRTPSYAYKMGIEVGYRAGMQDPEAGKTNKDCSTQPIPEGLNSTEQE